MNGLLELQVIKVQLKQHEIEKAHEIGFLRAKEIGWTGDNHANRKSREGNYHRYITELAESVASEMVVAKWLKIADFEPTLNTFKTAADVGSKIEVKWTHWWDGHLIIHQYDRNDDVAILVTGQSPTYQIVGWLPVVNAKISNYWVQAERNWWVPQRELWEIENFERSSYATSSL